MAKAGPASLRALFDALERRLAREDFEWSGFTLELCGRVVELRFSTPEAAANASRGFRGFIARANRAPDAVFKYWVDDCANYYRAEDVRARWELRDGDGCFANLAGSGFACGDFKRKRFYHCAQRGLAEDPTRYAHPLHVSFGQWARAEGMRMLHAAAVGVDGRGALIAGRSGAGKSTLSVACMLAGMDFVSDDFTVLGGADGRTAMPVYSSVCLNPDMAERLRPDMPARARRGSGKLEFDASARPFAREIPIRALLCPVAADADAPEIVAAPAGGLIVRVAHSSAQTFGGVRDRELVRDIAARLAGLPAYELRQCRDFGKNAELLRKFLKEMV